MLPNHLKTMHPSKKIAVLGNNWFPDRPGGLDRYIYELVHTLATPDTEIDLFGIGLPTETTTPSIQLQNLAEPSTSLGQRLYSAYRNSRSISLRKIRILVRSKTPGHSKASKKETDRMMYG